MHTRTLAGLTAALLCGATTAGAATYTARVSTKTLPPTADNTQTFNLGSAAPVSLAAHSQGSEAMGSTQISVVADASAQAGLGGLHLDIDAVGSTAASVAGFDYANFSAQAKASASFGDRFMVTAPSLAHGATISAMAGFGVLGYLGASVSTSGTLLDPNFAPSGGGSVGWTASMNVNGNQVFSGQRSCSDTLPNTGFNCFGDPFGVVWVPVVLYNGYNNSVSFQGEVSLSIYGGQGLGVAVLSQAFGDLSHTIGWAGLRDLRDANGQAVTMTAISASTGLNYLDAQISVVPEPAAAWTWIAGLGVVLGVLRRRRA